MPFVYAAGAYTSRIVAIAGCLIFASLFGMFISNQCDINVRFDPISVKAYTDTAAQTRHLLSHNESLTITEIGFEDVAFEDVVPGYEVILKGYGVYIRTKERRVLYFKRLFDAIFAHHYVNFKLDTSACIQLSYDYEVDLETFDLVTFLRDYVRYGTECDSAWGGILRCATLRSPARRLEGCPRAFSASIQLPTSSSEK